MTDSLPIEQLSHEHDFEKFVDTYQDIFSDWNVACTQTDSNTQIVDILPELVDIEDQMKLIVKTDDILDQTIQMIRDIVVDNAEPLAAVNGLHFKFGDFSSTCGFDANGGYVVSIISNGSLVRQSCYEFKISKAPRILYNMNQIITLDQTDDSSFVYSNYSWLEFYREGGMYKVNIYKDNYELFTSNPLVRKNLSGTHKLEINTNGTYELFQFTKNLFGSSNFYEDKKSIRRRYFDMHGKRVDDSLYRQVYIFDLDGQQTKSLTLIQSLQEGCEVFNHYATYDPGTQSWASNLSVGLVTGFDLTLDEIFEELRPQVFNGTYITFKPDGDFSISTIGPKVTNYNVTRFGSIFSLSRGNKEIGILQYLGEGRYILKSKGETSERIILGMDYQTGEISKVEISSPIIH